MTDPTPVELVTKEEFFFTTHRPHAWTSGPTTQIYDPERGWASIDSLERARELAKQHERLTGDESRVEVTWGVRTVIREDVDYYGRHVEKS